MKLFDCVILLSAITFVCGIRFKGVNQFLNIEHSLYRFSQHPIERQRVVSTADEFFQELQDEKLPRSRHTRSIHNDESVANSNLETSNFTFNEDHNLAYIAWSGKNNSDTIVTLFRDSFITATSTSSVYVSHDYGKTYKNLTGLFRNESGINVRLDGFLDSPDDYRDYIFISQEDKALFTSQDEARTFHYHKLTFTPSDIITHPFKGDILFAYDEPAHEAYLSLDFGEHWTSMSTLFPHEPVGGVYWGAELGQDDVIYVATETQNGLYNIYKTDLHLTKSSPLFTFPVHEFDIAAEYMYAVRVKDSAASSKALLVSFDGGSFQEAEFSSVADDPQARLVERSYYVADGSEGQLVVAVNHQYNLTNLYISETRGIRFSLSLERVLYHDPNLTDVSSSWLYRVRDTKLLDFHKAGGLRGIYIATQLTVGSVGGRYLRTYISYDKGGEWSRINPPKLRYDNQSIVCDPPDCYLNLASEFSSIYRTYKTEPILSKSSTPGIIMATGSVGKNLYLYGDLMVSNTAGATWVSALPGFNYYQFGDNGGFMVATPKYYHGLKNYIYYSLDEGANWQKYTFSQQKLLIWGLSTEPGEYTTEVTLYGSTTYYQHPFKWVVVRIDMRGVLGSKCTESNYFQWSPSDDIPNRGCLLGSLVRYQRKKLDVQCYQGLNFTRNTSSHLCTCTRIDYECDFGYDLEEGDNTCQSTDNSGTIIPAFCVPGSSYMRSTGYRKVAGDKCIGGDAQFDPVETACPGQNSQFHLDVSGPGVTHDLLLYSVPHSTQVLITAHVYNQTQLDLSNHTYLWSIDNKVIHSGDMRVSYTFSRAETYIVSLIISSPVFSATNSTLVRVLDPIDPTQFSISAPSCTYINQNTLVSVLLPLAIDNYGLLSYRWTWNDGNNDLAFSLSPSQNIVFTSAGVHQVCLDVMNAISNSTLSPCTSIKVYPMPEVTDVTFQYFDSVVQISWTPSSPVSSDYSYSVIDVTHCSSVAPSLCCSASPACCSASKILASVTGSYQSVILPGLLGNYTYKLVVVARHSDKSYCTSSAVYQTTTAEGVPGPPSLVSVSQMSDGIQLTWSPPVHPNGVITGYRVVSYIGSMPVLNAQSSRFSQTTAKLTHLWPAVMYSFYLQARTARGYGLVSPRPLNIMSPANANSTLTPIDIETPDGQLASYSQQDLEDFMNALSNFISNYGDVYSPVMLSSKSIVFLFNSNPKQKRFIHDVPTGLLSALKTFSYEGITITRSYQTDYSVIIQNIITSPSAPSLTTTPTPHSVVDGSSSVSVGIVISLLISLLFNLSFIIIMISLCFSLHKTNKLRKQRYAVLTNFNAEDEEVTVNEPMIQTENLSSTPPNVPQSVSFGLEQIIASENDDDPLLEVHTNDTTPLLS